MQSFGKQIRRIVNTPSFRSDLIDIGSLAGYITNYKYLILLYYMCGGGMKYCNEQVFIYIVRDGKTSADQHYISFIPLDIVFNITGQMRAHEIMLRFI